MYSTYRRTALVALPVDRVEYILYAQLVGGVWSSKVNFRFAGHTHPCHELFFFLPS